MSENLGKRLAILRLIPIIVLVVIAFGLEYLFGVSRLIAAGAALVVAIIARLALMKFWTPQ